MPPRSSPWSGRARGTFLMSSAHTQQPFRRASCADHVRVRRRSVFWRHEGSLCETRICSDVDRCAPHARAHVMRGGRHPESRGGARADHPSCGSFHTFFVRFAIDVAFIDRRRTILENRAWPAPCSLVAQPKPLTTNTASISVVDDSSTGHCARGDRGGQTCGFGGVFRRPSAGPARRSVSVTLQQPRTLPRSAEGWFP